MPEAQVAVAPAVTQSTTTEAPAVEPVKPTEPATEDWQARYRKLEADTARRNREHIIERRKWDASRQETGQRLSRLSELEKREQSARLNPPAFLESIYGKNWHEVVQEAKLNGVPPAQLIQDEVARLREEFEAKLKAKDEEISKSQQSAQQRQVEQVRAQMRLDGEDFYEANSKDYPIFEKLGNKAAVAKRLAEHIEAEFHRTTQRDEAGNILRQGRVLTLKEAADAVEGEMLAVAEAAFKAEKYKSRWAPKEPDLTPGKESDRLNPASQSSKSQSNGQQSSRRTLSNDITGSTKGDKPPTTPEERRKRAEAAFAAVRAKKAATP